MKILLSLISLMTLCSCATSVILVGCGATAINMPSAEPVHFNAVLDVDTQSGWVQDSLTLTCEVKERKCLGGDWRVVWKEQNIASFDVPLSPQYHASITGPSCRNAESMSMSDRYGYVEKITVFDSSSMQSVYEGVANNEKVKKYGFISLSVNVNKVDLP